MTTEEEARARSRELFALAPDAFVAARDALVRELKDADEPVLAAEVKKLRRPSVVAWAVNAAARERPSDVEALLRAGDQLQRAQRAAISGEGARELREQTQARRRLIALLTEVAAAALGDRAGAHRDAIASTLEAASVDRQLGTRLRDGMVEREATPGSGLGAPEGFKLLQGSGDDDRKRVEDRVALQRRARETERTAVVAEQKAGRAAARAELLRAKAREASSAASAAEADARRLADEARTARRVADRASSSKP